MGTYQEPVNHRTPKRRQRTPTIKNPHRQQTPPLLPIPIPLLPLPPLMRHKRTQRHTPARNRRNHLWTIPIILNSSPAQADQEDRHAPQEECGAEPVRASQFLAQGEGRAGVQADEEDGEEEAEGAEGEVYVEDPAPGCVFTDGAADYGADDGTWGKLEVEEVIG